MNHSEYSISTDKSRFDVKLIHEFLTNSYWAEGVPLEIVRRSIQNALCFGVFHGGRQVGFARVISDLAAAAGVKFTHALHRYSESPAKHNDQWPAVVFWLMALIACSLALIKTILNRNIGVGNSQEEIVTQLRLE